jgi:CRP/FNR family cyclic AMP-dependent transcriptional regulator
MPSVTTRASTDRQQCTGLLQNPDVLENHPIGSNGDEADRRGDAQAAPFSSLSREAQSALTSVCREISVPSRQALFRQGTAHTSSYIIKSGLVRTYYTAQSGREVTLAFWSDGDLVGGPNFFGGGFHIWSAVAVRQSAVLGVQDVDLRRLAKSNPEILYWITDALSFKLRWLSILFQLHGTEVVLHRLARLLLMLGETYGEQQADGIVIRHKISQSDLSTLVGASRQWTNKTLNELQDKGLLSLDKRRIRIIDLDGLNALCGT